MEKKSTSTKAVPKKATAKKDVKKWSAHVNETSDSLDLERDIFKSDDPHKIATSLKHSAEKATGGKVHRCSQPCPCSTSTLIAEAKISAPVEGDARKG